MKKLITFTVLLIGFSQIEALFGGEEQVFVLGLNSAKATSHPEASVFGEESGTVI